MRVNRSTSDKAPLSLVYSSKLIFNQADFLGSSADAYQSNHEQLQQLKNKKQLGQHQDLQALAPPPEELIFTISLNINKAYC
ncbi:hypothetical protein [Shewanella surugensis]|uniref:Uncharacterized protein n=1 Tax=Shewanella surugensis TaxID=212020 RepID=A0ABT0LJB7_9GAMM|nr:hypothetical protein [Shewanella surugensis]MCL1127392.1 hypothetical protein [Shewanella surugensis]